MRGFKISLLIFSFGSITANAGVVYYGSSNAVLAAKNQEMFLMGFELGLGNNIPKNKAKDLLVIEQDTTGNPLGALVVAKKIFRCDPPIVVGFPTSHEALLVAKEYAKSGSLIIFAGAGHSELASFGNTVHTTGESMEFSTGMIIDFLKNKFGGQHGAVIGNPYAVFSKNFDDGLTAQIRSHRDVPKLEFFKLSKDQQLGEKELLRLRTGHFDFMLISSYPDECVRLLEQLDQAHIDLPIVTNSSWTTGDVDYLRRLLSKKTAAVYSAALWLPGSQSSRGFEALVKSRFGRDATSEIAYGYDLGIIVGKTLIAAKSDYSNGNLLRTFLNLRCFDGLASGRICFQRSGGHAVRTLQFVQFTNHGLIPVR